jgi:DNA-binding LacI/PurR family transcriptional regulator
MDRAEGYQQAMTQANIPAENHHVFWGEFTQDSGYNLTHKALKSSVQLTALITANNFIAVGAMRALDEDDLKVPDDMSLVTFDDLPPTMTIRPFFTMAYQPAYEIGYQAAEMLLRRLSDDDLPFQEIILPIELIVRQSSGPYRKPRREH